MAKILITDPVDQQCVDIFSSSGFEVENRPGISKEEIKKIIHNVDALIVRSQTDVSADVLDVAKQLKIIGRAGAGVDNIDVDAATRRGIIVMNTPGGNTVSTAEHTLALMMALARNIPHAHQSVLEGKWERKKFVGTELHGKTLGIIGLGKVGAEVARRCLAFGMNVIAYDPVLSSESAAKTGITLMDLNEVYKRSDFITIHNPLTPETKGMIGDTALAKCKRGVRIINCARGGIVNEAALLKALNDGRVAGAALDVFEQEPPGVSPLIQHPHVVVTPHLGASTEEAQEKVAIQIAHQVSDYLRNGIIAGAVNADIIQLAHRQEIRPFMELSDKMGRFLAQLKEGKLRSITISVSGELLHDVLPAISSAVLKGFFDNVFSESVNYLNAPLIARERGIVIQLHQHDEQEFYANVLTVRYETDKEQREFSGTVFGNKDVRIIAIDGFHFEFKPEGNLMLYYNIDQPGMLANVSGVLSRAGINIAALSLGRHQQGTKALTVIATDTQIPSHVSDQVARLEGISGIRLASL
jgi:D-3-phosphoglycerate dehydrogenase